MASSLKLSARDYPIKAVTVYKSKRAEVVRVFSLDLQSGNTKIEITELPSCIDTHSVRVSGLDDARLFDVVCTTRGDKPAKPSEALRLLRTQKLALEGQKRVRDYESDLLVAYAKTLSGEHVAPTEMNNFLKTFVDQGKKNLEAVAELDEKIVALDRDIERELEKEAARKGAATGEVTIVIGTDAPSRVDLKLTYIVSNASWESTYELHAATENGKPSPAVTLHYRARIVQSTGEDWDGTALTLSTVAASTIVKTIPFLHPIKIRPSASRGLFGGGNKGAPRNNANNVAFGQQAFGQAPPVPAGGGFGAFGAAPNVQQQQQQQQQQPVGGGGLFGASQQPVGGTSLFGSGASNPVGGHAFGAAPAPAFGAATGFQFAAASADSAGSAGAPIEGGDDFEEIAIPGVQAGPTTVVTETPLAISYAVDGKTTVPSDGTAHQVAVAVLPFEAKISHICTPRIDPRVYLQCNVRNTSEYRLLPGPVSVVLNDSFVSKTSINEINTGDTFACTLGDDAATKVTYSRSSKTTTVPAGAFAEALNSTTCTTKIAIHNKHAFALTDLVVRDIIPTSDDKRAKVLLHRPAGLADAKDGEVVSLDKEKDKDGKELAGLKVRWGKTPDGRPGEKDGRYEWTWSIDAGKQVELEAEWELKAPADVNWVEFVPFSFGP